MNGFGMRRKFQTQPPQRVKVSNAKMIVNEQLLLHPIAPAYNGILSSPVDNRALC